jgi:hypothetical protein
VSRLQRFATLFTLIPLAVGPLSAQIFTQSTRMTGNLPAASVSVYGTNYSANFSIAPVVLTGNNVDTYMVYWNVTVYGSPQQQTCVLPTDPPPLPPDAVNTVASGLLPISAVRKLAGNDFSLDLDVNNLQQLLFFASSQCIKGVCTSLPLPTSFPLKGTISAVTSGPGTHVSIVNGSNSTLTIDSICRNEVSFNGQQENTAARFAGKIGSITAPAMAVGSNGELQVRKGQWYTTITCTPPTPI